MLEVKNDKFNDAQKAYIRKYAAGLLLAWAGPAVLEHITPDTLDGFEPPKEVFPVDEENIGTDEDLVYDGANEVGVLLDSWLDKIAEMAGFTTQTTVQEAYNQMDTNTVYMKYPIMKEETNAVS